MSANANLETQSGPYNSRASGDSAIIATNR